mgnify:CR=1 FL=1
MDDLVVANAIEKDLKKWSSIDVQIKHNGKEIILPAFPSKMSYAAGVSMLQRAEEAENQKYEVVEFVKGAPWDCLVAITRSMQKIYGVVLAQSIKTFFGEIKPKLVTVDIGPHDDDKIQVATGRMSLPGITESVNVGMTPEGAYIQSTVKKAEREALIEIVNTAKQILREDSIYKSKSIKFDVSDDGDLEIDTQPTFLDLADVSETDIIHPAVTTKRIVKNIFAPLKYTENCRINRVPLKRGILLYGPYGTGKSLTARVTAKVANDNGWTFITLGRSQGLRAAIEFAKNYQPCVIFAEDIDRAADREDENVNDLVNMLDGVLTKDMEIMVVLTTNFIDKIDRSLLRPGRFDAIIPLTLPDAETCTKLVRHYGRNLIPASIDLTGIGQKLYEANAIPASVREAVERSKLSMFTENRQFITLDDLSDAADDMKAHSDIVNQKPTEKSDGDMLWSLLNKANAGGNFVNVADNVVHNMSELRDTVKRHTRHVSQTVEEAKELSASAGAAANSASNLVEESLKHIKNLSTRMAKVEKAIA